MTVEQEIKKLTLFLNDAHPLSEDALVEYVSPMEELGFHPVVSKGITIRYNGASDTLDKIDAWTVDFLHDTNPVKVIVDVDRVVIEIQSSVDWKEVMEKAGPIIRIAIQNNQAGFSRIAVGSTQFGKVSPEDLKACIHISEAEAGDERALEKTERFVRESVLRNERGEELLKYNDVHTFKVLWRSEGINYMEDYDINTSMETGPETVTSSIDRFFSEAISRLAEIKDHDKSAEEL